MTECHSCLDETLCQNMGAGSLCSQIVRVCPFGGCSSLLLYPLLMCPVVLGGMHHNRSRPCVWNETFAGRTHQSVSKSLIFVFVVLVQEDICCRLQVVVCVKGPALEARASTLQDGQGSLVLLVVVQLARFCVSESRPATASAPSSILSW